MDHPINKSKNKVAIGGDADLVYQYLPDENSRQTSSLKVAKSVLERMRYENADSNIDLLDFGCGIGKSHELLVGGDPLIRWLGLDLISSPEVDSRRIRGLPMVAYDGVRIPLRDNCMDVIYTHQVLEHVRYPSEVLAELMRVLRPGGVLVGSTSHLEPYHSRSLWNYTPYGFASLLDSVGFWAICVRPGIDGVTLIVRRLLGYLKLRILDWAFENESPLNAILEIAGRIMRVDVKKRVTIKLLFSGHFIFTAKKPTL